MVTGNRQKWNTGRELGMHNAFAGKPDIGSLERTSKSQHDDRQNPAAVRDRRFDRAWCSGVQPENCPGKRVGKQVERRCGQCEKNDPDFLNGHPNSNDGEGL
jgi:hypothetical protein